MVHMGDRDPIGKPVAHLRGHPRGWASPPPRLQHGELMTFTRTRRWPSPWSWLWWEPPAGWLGAWPSWLGWSSLPRRKVTPSAPPLPQNTLKHQEYTTQHYIVHNYYSLRSSIQGHYQKYIFHLYRTTNTNREKVISFCLVGRYLLMQTLHAAIEK
jgi:hypothetical protein